MNESNEKKGKEFTGAGSQHLRPVLFLAVSVQNQSPAGPLRAWGSSWGLTLSPTQADPGVTLPVHSLLSITRLSEWVTVRELCARAQEKRALCGSQETLTPHRGQLCVVLPRQAGRGGVANSISASTSLF